MSLADGTVSVLDGGAVCYSRVWCTYEVFVSLSGARESEDGRKYKYDVYTAWPDEKGDLSATGFSDGLTAVDEEAGKSADWLHRGGAYGYKSLREKAFPLELAAMALAVQLQSAKATCEDDRRHILNAIAGQELDAEPLQEHPSYDLVNHALQWRMAMAMFPSADEAGRLEELRLQKLQEPEGWHAEALTLYRGMAQAWSAQGTYQRAGDFLGRVLRIQQSQLGPKHMEVAPTYYEMGLTYYRQGKDQIAIGMLQECFRIQVASLGAEHEDVAATYRSIGDVWRMHGQAAKALEFYQKCLAIQQSAPGGAKPEMAATYNGMAKVYMRQGEHGKSHELLEQALAIQLAAFGKEHPEVALTYWSKGMAYHKQGDLSLALDLFEESIAIQLKTLGELHPKVATTHFSIGEVLCEQGKHSLAAKHYQDALAIQMTTLGKHHCDTNLTQRSLGKVYCVLETEDTEEDLLA